MAIKPKLALEEIQSLLKVMRTNKVAAFELGELKVSFHPEAFLTPVEEELKQPLTEEQKIELRKKEEERLKQEENDLLFHSAE